MSKISSETLFHFTTKPDYLFKILENCFTPRYYPEVIDIKGMTKSEIAIPMVCFCDIPLSQIKNHIDTYGEYGIGMSKNWAKKNNLNPVIYLEKDSILTSSIVSEIKATIKNGNIDKSKILNVIRYIKSYQGEFRRKGKIITGVKFYDEREWRYVPKSDSKLKFWLTAKELVDDAILAEGNLKLQDFTLDFEIDDIKYIIIKNESEIPTMISAMKHIKSKKYDAKEIEILISRIITTEQINRDF